MELIKQLHQRFLNEQYALNDETLSLHENCEMIMESDTRVVCTTAIEFLNKFATDVKKGTFSKIDNKAKKLIGIYTTLELLKDRQAHNEDKVTNTSLRKYLDNDKELDFKELDEVQSHLAGILSKLKNLHHEKGTVIRDRNIKMVQEEPDQLLANINKLKAKYRAYSKRV
jgi:hypothetical protein